MGTSPRLEQSRPLQVTSKKPSFLNQLRKCQILSAIQSVNSRIKKRLPLVSREVQELRSRLKFRDSTTISDKEVSLSQESAKRIDQPSSTPTMLLSMPTTSTTSVCQQRMRTSQIPTTCSSKMISTHPCVRSWLTGLFRSTSSIDSSLRLYSWL